MIRLFVVLTILIAQLLSAAGVDTAFKTLLDVPDHLLTGVGDDGTETVSLATWAKFALGHVAHIILAAIAVRVFIVRNALHERSFDPAPGMWLAAVGLLLLIAPFIVVLFLAVQLSDATPQTALIVIFILAYQFGTTLTLVQLAGNLLMLGGVLMFFRELPYGDAALTFQSGLATGPKPRTRLVSKQAVNTAQGNPGLSLNPPGD